MKTFEDTNEIYILIDGKALKKAVITEAKPNPQNPVQSLIIKAGLNTYCVRRGDVSTYIKGGMIGTSKEAIKTAIEREQREIKSKIKACKDMFDLTARRLYMIETYIGK